VDNFFWDARYRKTVSTEELARRVIGEHQLTAMRVGSVPERFGIPVPKDARVIGSVVRGLEDDPDMVTAYFDVPGSADGIRKTFDDAFGARGFKPKRPGGPSSGQPGGFEHTMRPMAMAQGAIYCSGEEGPYYQLGIGARDPAPVTITWQSGQNMGWHPCSSNRPGHPMRDMEDVPSLSAPPSVMIQGGGAGGSPGAWYAHGVAFTAMRAGDLLAHFARELEASGAKELAREDADTASWGRWELPTKDVETIVGVVAAHPEMRLLLRYTYSPKMQRHQARMMGSTWSSSSFRGLG
jgi:hypothetical protein